MAAVDVVTTLGAFVVIVVGVAMLHLFRKLQVGESGGLSREKAEGQRVCVPESGDGVLLQMTMMELTSQLSQPAARNEGGEEASPSLTAEGRRRRKKEDKYGLMDNMVIESLPPMREEGPRVFIIS